MNKMSLIKKIRLIYKYPKVARNLAQLSIYQRLNKYPNFHFPIHVTIFVTERCNLNCHMCLISKSRYICGMTTNGVLLDKYSEQIINSNIDFLSISLDGPKDIHDISRGIKGTYDKVISGINKIVSLKKDNEFPNIKINCVVQEMNIDEMEHIIRLATDLQVDELQFQHLSFYDKKIMSLCNDYKNNRKIMVDLQGVELDRGPISIDKIEKLNEIKRKTSLYNKKYKINISFRPETNCIERYYSFDYPSKSSRCLGQNSNEGKR